MRVVITRPQPAAERTAAALAARGHSVWVVPLMQVEPVEADLSGDWGGVIITSANAARRHRRQPGARARCWRCRCSRSDNAARRRRAPPALPR